MTVILQEPITGSDATYTSQTHLSNPTRVALDTSLISGGNAIGQVEIIDGTAGPMLLDSTSNSVTTTEFEHQEIHQGESFVLFGHAAGGDGTEKNFHFTTPNTTKWIHVFPQARSNVEANAEVWEGGTWSGAVAQLIVPYNRNRNSVNTSDLVIKQDVVISGGTPSSGLLLAEVHIGAGRQGGEARSVEEWILKSGTEYLFRVEAEAASSDIDLELNWYEHTNEAIVD